MPWEKEMILDVILWFSERVDVNSLENIFFGVKVATGFTEPLTTGWKLLFVTLLEEQLFHGKYLCTGNGLNSC